MVFKSSFDKANRTTSKSFRDPEFAEGSYINSTELDSESFFNIVLIVDSSCICYLHYLHRLYCDSIFDATKKTGKILNIKKGQFCAPSVSDSYVEPTSFSLTCVDMLIGFDINQLV